MSLIEDLEGTLVDCCIVCGSEDPNRMRRTISQTLGGAYAEMKLTVEYCADNAACGEAAAMWLMEELTGQFVIRDLRRRRLSLLDLGVPPG